MIRLDRVRSRHIINVARNVDVNLLFFLKPKPCSPKLNLVSILKILNSENISIA